MFLGVSFGASHSIDLTVSSRIAGAVSMKPKLTCGNTSLLTKSADKCSAYDGSCCRAEAETKVERAAYALAGLLQTGRTLTIAPALFGSAHEHMTDVHVKGMRAGGVGVFVGCGRVTRKPTRPRRHACPSLRPSVVDCVQRWGGTVFGERKAAMKCVCRGGGGGGNPAAGLPAFSGRWCGSSLQPRACSFC